MKFKNAPIRTCIVCRGKNEQSTMLRIQCINKKVVQFSGLGRSFYLCGKCCDDTTKLTKSLYRQCKNKADYELQLKEMIEIWKTK